MEATISNEHHIQANLANHSEKEKSLFSEYGDYFDNSPITTSGKLQNFTKYVRRQDISRFLAKNELFKLQLNVALETFLPRIPKGGIIAFDELNTKVFPGETLALLDTYGIKNARLQRTPFDPYISYAILE